MNEKWGDKKKETLSGRPAKLPKESGAPDEINPKTGQHKDYWVLPESERKKGFVRPVRQSYVHVGDKPKHPLRDLTDKESEQFKTLNYAKCEVFPVKKGEQAVRQFWTQEQLDKKACNTSTKMGTALAETYARDPKYYGMTFCCACKDHIKVSEFVWEGTEEVVGS